MKTHQPADSIYGVKVTGTPSPEELRSSGGFPKDDRQRTGPVAFIECVELIPCNPCEAACPYGAISVGQDITALPALDGAKCIGCGLCIAVCPGLAIYVKDFTFEPLRATIAFPYEYVPLPEKGQVVVLSDRNGEAVCDGTVVQVINGKRNDRTAVVKVVFDRKHYDSVISMRRPAAQQHSSRLTSSDT